VLPQEAPELSVTPSRLYLETDGTSGTLMVSNHSPTVTALTVSGQIASTALNGKVTQDATHCTSIAPGSSCTLIFTPVSGAGTVNLTAFQITGSNTASVGAAMGVYANTPLSVTPSKLSLETDGTSGAFTVTNESATATALNISGEISTTALNGKVTQTTTGCASVAPGASCTLTFTPVSSAGAVNLTPFQIRGGNTETIGAAIGVYENAPLSVVPKRLNLQTNGSSGFLTVINESSTETALNVSAQISTTALNGAVTQNVTDCTSIAPGASCSLTFTPVSAGHAVSLTPFEIVGSNTSPVGAAIAIYGTGTARISVSGSPLILQDTTPGSLIVTNLSTIDATNVAATLTGELATNITQNSTDCANLPANSSCTLTFVSNNGDALPPRLMIISGENTTQNGDIIAVNEAAAYSLTISSGSPLALITHGSSGDMIVKNTSTVPLCGISSDFTNTDLAGNVSQTASTCPACPSGLAVNSECTLTFTPGNNAVDQTAFPITGTTIDLSNSATVNGEISISYSQSYVYVESPGFITRCIINTATGYATTCVDANSDGSLSISSGDSNAFTVEPAGNYFYVTKEDLAIYRCLIDASTGMLSNCQGYVPSFSLNYPTGLAVNPNPSGTQQYLSYIDGTQNTIGTCALNASDGAIETNTCTTFSSTSFSGGQALTFNSAGTYTYVTAFLNSGTQYGIYTCSVNNGAIGGCGSLLFVNPPPYGITLNAANSLLYTASALESNLASFDVTDSGGTVSGQVTYSVTNKDTGGIGILKIGTYIYVMGEDSKLYYCPVSTVDGSVSTCVDAAGELIFGNFHGLSLWNP